MNEKDVYLTTWAREFQTTLKVLGAYPKDKLNYKPHERSRSARELAWTFVIEEGIVDGIIKGQINFEGAPGAPDTLDEILSQYEKTHREMVERVKVLSEAEYHATIKFPVAPRQMGDLRRAEALWTLLMDSVHHRGQFSVYLRMVGAKVPSIYGPSADEPWF